MKGFAAVLFIGTFMTLVALPHLASLLCCRRVAARCFPLVHCGCSYGIAAVLSGAMVVRVSAGAAVVELAEFFLPFSLVVLTWWAAIFIPLRRARGVSRITILAIAALFVPSVIVCTSFTSFPADKWLMGDFTDHVALELDVASAFLWPSWLVAVLVLAIYTWSPFALRREERLRAERLPRPPGRDRGVSPVEHDPNPYSPPR